MSQPHLPSSTPADPPANPRSRIGGLLLIGGVAVVGLILLVVFYYGILHPPSVRVGSGKAPEFTFSNYNFGLSEFDGQTMRLSDLRGKPVVVNFWASWCVPCREEQAGLEQAWQKYRDQVWFVGLDYLDQEPNARAYLSEFAVSYPNGADKGGRAYSTYHVQGVPETFFIDAEGNIQGFFVGPIPQPELERRIEELLAPAPG